MANWGCNLVGDFASEIALSEVWTLLVRGPRDLETGRVFRGRLGCPDYGRSSG
ncbi:hypothetical protein FOTG_10227 [Fusarium oxysporum f. sp. vasinfectum 25433]|uniref:Uncharacterized protein n=1 Tax=Fusarium oxysporum f. sp. vasinfectum 25433 TaxID=1089449 RepID=X0LL95_FUSOX|nr:hypothetical protein FOTG_10227 [Fusarium oxysporum f. sp. vasinfectum 25433]